jgi:nitric-oxide synthase, bacterial
MVPLDRHLMTGGRCPVDGTVPADGYSPGQQAVLPTLAEAEEFLSTCRRERGTSLVPPERIGEVAHQVRETGTYQHTTAELRYGAQLAWRNALDCIGKGAWQKLIVRDARAAATADEVFDACLGHLRFSTNGGRIRPVLTAMSPQDPAGQGTRIWNSQLIRYAGYRLADGSVVGDGGTVRFTEAVQSLGWAGDGLPFDVLPLVIQTPGDRPRWYRIPRDVVLEVWITHPDFPWFADLSLRWYAHPAISNQLLRIGGICYPAAPFSGWYTCTEIAAQNLADPGRYNVLPKIAERMGLDMSSSRTLWQDIALTELMRAVMHSYDKQNVTIIDHHFAATAFARHQRHEAAAGRPTYARWGSLISVTGAHTQTISQASCQEEVILPNFFSQAVLGDTSAR